MAERPSIGFALARELGVIEQLLPEMVPLYTCPQDPEWHPEGDVWTHTLMVIDEARRRNADLARPQLAIIMLGAVCHDLGKPMTTIHVDGRVKSPGHEAAGVAPATRILDRLNVNTLDGFDVRRQVLGIVAEHLRPSAFHKAQETVKDGAFRRLAQRVDLELLTRFARADCHGRTGTFDCSAMDWFIERARTLGVEHRPPSPILMGRHLLEMGLTPGPRMGEILKAVYEQQLDGAVTTLEEAQAAARVADRRAELTPPTTELLRIAGPRPAAELGARRDVLRERLRRDVAAAHHRDHGLCALGVAQPQHDGGGRRRAARLDDEPRMTEQPRHRLGNRRVRHRDELVDELAHVRERHVAGTDGQETVGDRPGLRQRHRLTRRNRGLHRRRAFRLDADDAHRAASTA